MSKVKKHFTFMLILILVLVFFISPATSFANTSNEIDVCESELITLKGTDSFFNTPNVEVAELSLAEKEVALKGSDYVNKDESEVYTVKQIFGGNTVEAVVVADVAIAKPMAAGTKTLTKDGRVNITGFLGYDILSYQGVDFIRGTRFGGKVNSQQGGLAVTEVKGVYSDSGACITSDGQQTMDFGYRKTAYFSITNRYEMQTSSVSRNLYFDTSMPATFVSTQFSVTYEMLGNSHTIFITVSA